MKQISRFWNISVYDCYNKQVRVKTHYLDSWYEAETTLLVSSFDFTVKEAKLEVMRSPYGQESCGVQRFDEMKGIKAFQGMGVAKKTMEATKSELWGGMFLEGVKALRQSRMFIWDRENVDLTPYIELIKRAVMNSCIYFSTPESVQTLLSPKQLGEHKRGDLLFARYRYSFLDNFNGRKNVFVGLSDSYHEMKLKLNIDNDIVTYSEGDILRAPQEICHQAENNVKNLKGRKLPVSPKDWEEELLGPSSCTHLADLAREAVSSINYVRGELLYEKN